KSPGLGVDLAVAERDRPDAASPQLAQLGNAARRCPVHTILMKPKTADREIEAIVKRLAGRGKFRRPLLGILFREETLPIQQTQGGCVIFGVERGRVHLAIGTDRLDLAERSIDRTCDTVGLGRDLEFRNSRKGRAIAISADGDGLRKALISDSEACELIGEAPGHSQGLEPTFLSSQVRG